MVYKQAVQYSEIAYKNLATISQTLIYSERLIPANYRNVNDIIINVSISYTRFCRRLFHLHSFCQ